MAQSALNFIANRPMLLHGSPRSEAGNAARDFPCRIRLVENAYSRRVTAPGMDFMTEAQERYAEYLQSDHWRELRLQAFKEYGRKCSECPATCRLEVHHKIYRYPWFSGVVQDLKILCHNCHQREHGFIPPLDRRERKRLQKSTKRKVYDLTRLLHIVENGIQLTATQKSFVSHKLLKGKRHQRQAANTILQMASKLSNRHRLNKQLPRTGNFVVSNGRLLYSP